MNWITHIIIFQILLGQVLSYFDDYFMCPSNETCSCKSPIGDILQLECTDLYTVYVQYLLIYTPYTLVKIKCHTAKTIHWRKHFDNLPGLYTDFYFSGCHLSNLEIHEILSTLGMQKVQHLMLNDITLYGSLEKVLTNLNTVKHLNLNAIRLYGNLEKTFFSNLENVKSIQNSNTKLILTNESFNGTPYLEYLILRKNNIEKIPKFVFRHLYRLKELDLAENNITNIESDLFDGIPLKMLDLSSNHLTTLSLNVPSLLTLLINNNRLTYFEPEALNVPKLTYLELAHNKIRSLTINSSFALRNLVEVDSINLSYNYINCIDPGLTNLKKLIRINLNSNNFTVLRLQEFLYINRIEQFLLTSNPLEEIDISGLEEIAKTEMLPRPSWSKRNVHLSSDKFISDCRNYEFARLLHNQMPSIVQKYLQIEEELICNDGTEFSKVNTESLTCDWKMFKDVDKIDCLRECECTYRPHDKSALMNCSNRSLTSAPKKIISSKNLNYTELNIRYNYITKLPNYENFNIKKLNIGYNNLITMNLTQLPKNLMELHLENNNLTKIGETNDLNNTLTNIRILTMSSNPWICDCDTKNTLHFINKYSSKISDLLDIKCNQSSTLLYTDFEKLNPENLCEDSSNTTHRPHADYDTTTTNEDSTSTTTFAVIFLAVLSLVLLFSLLLIMYKNYNVKVWLYSHNITCLISEEYLDRDKKYDVFLSYSHKDQDLIYDHLLPGLEQGSPSFTVCIHERDWVAGDFILDQIARSVDESRKTVIVLSQHFLASDFGRMEFKTAMTNALKERRSRIIVIRYGDVSTDDLDSELRTFLFMNTYIQWGDSQFWDRLRYALRRRPETKTKTNTKIIVPDEFNLVPLM